jgi:putative ABC transport system permease protein
MVGEDTARDIRIGLRVLVKEKAFCGLAIFVLALGISAVSTQFAMVNGIMLRGFSFPTADRLADVSFIDPASRTAFGVNRQTYTMDYEEYLPSQKSFELMTAYLDGSTVNMTVDGQARRYTGAYVTDTFLRVLGTKPALGRDITAADNRPGAEKVALIGHGMWQRDFGGASDILGRPIRLNGKPATIVGVMPQGFVFPANEEIWIPLYSEFPVRPRTDAQANSPGVIGLLKPGMSLDQAHVEFSGFAKRFAAGYPETNKAFSEAEVRPLIDRFTGTQLRGMMWTMLAFCVGVLLIACVNVMNMQLARATIRARELAVRSSLGATRSRLIRQMLTESSLLAAAGAILGTGLAYLSIDWLSATLKNMDNPPPAWMTFTLDAPVLIFTVGATAAAALVSGILPAWMASRARVVDVLREGGRGNTSRGIGFVSRGLVVMQIIVTCVLLIGSLLQLRSILNQQDIDYGYDTAGLMSARMGLMEGDYPAPEARRIFYDRLLRELTNSGQFEAVALTSRLRMVYSGSGPIEIDGKVYKARRDRPNANFEQVTGSFFQVTGQKLLEGRTFQEDDADTRQPVAIVNAAFAKKHFSGQSAVGRRFRTGDGESGPYGPWRTIIGVVSTVRMMGPFNNPNVDETGFYVPFYATAFGAAPPTLAASQFSTVVAKPHPGQHAEGLLKALRREVNKVDPNLPLYFAGTPRFHLDSAAAAFRIIASMFTLFGAIAILLAAVGIYGVMSFSVNQRRQEFGVRMALGADTGRILAMVLKQGSRQVVAGLTVGIGLSLLIALLGRSGIETMLIGVTALDPATYVSVAVLVAAVSLAAVLGPARRATRVDPMLALRAE